MKRIFVILFVCIALCGGAGAADSADRIAAVAVNEDIMVFFVPDGVSQRLSVRDRLIQSEDIADAAEYLLTHRGNAVIDEIQMHRVGKQPF